MFSCLVLTQPPQKEQCSSSSHASSGPYHGGSRVTQASYALASMLDTSYTTLLESASPSFCVGACFSLGLAVEDTDLHADLEVKRVECCVCWHTTSLVMERELRVGHCRALPAGHLSSDFCCLRPGSLLTILALAPLSLPEPYAV